MNYPALAQSFRIERPREQDGKIRPGKVRLGKAESLWAFGRRPYNELRDAAFKKAT